MLTYNKQYGNVGMVFMDCDPGKGHPQPSKQEFKRQGDVSYLSHIPGIASTTTNTCSWGRGAPHHPLMWERPMRCRGLVKAVLARRKVGLGCGGCSEQPVHGLCPSPFERAHGNCL